MLLRRLKRDVEEQLPERTINNFFVQMEQEQLVRYDEYKLKVSRLLQIMKKRPLIADESKKLQQYLACMRLQDIKRFKTDPNCRFFLTTDSGSTGLNLQMANVVINLDLPWNLAKLEQRIARHGVRIKRVLFK